PLSPGAQRVERPGARLALALVGVLLRVDLRDRIDAQDVESLEQERPGFAGILLPGPVRTAQQQIGARTGDRDVGEAALLLLLVLPVGVLEDSDRAGRALAG